MHYLFLSNLCFQFPYPISVSEVIISVGVVIGALSMRFRVLLNILCVISSMRLAYSITDSVAVGQCCIYVRLL